MFKRGLSTIVTTVLILLLSIAAVILLWTFIRPLLSPQFPTDCVGQELTIKSASCTGNNVSVVVERTKGKLGKVKVMVNNDAKGTLAYTESTDVPEELGQKTYTVDYSVGATSNPSSTNSGDVPTFVTVGGYVTTTSGDIVACGVTQKYTITPTTGTACTGASPPQ